MKLLILHDINNPTRIIPMDPADFSMAAPYLSGGMVYVKDREAVLVHETPEAIAALLEEAQ
jgi:hypothetical protein